MWLKKNYNLFWLKKCVCVCVISLYIRNQYWIPTILNFNKIIWTFFRNIVFKTHENSLLVLKSSFLVIKYHIYRNFRFQLKNLAINMMIFCPRNKNGIPFFLIIKCHIYCNFITIKILRPKYDDVWSQMWVFYS